MANAPGIPRISNTRGAGTDYSESLTGEGVPDFVPFLEADPVHPERRDWYEVALKHLALNGNRLAAAMEARIGRSTLYRCLDDDPAFRSEWEHAREYFVARLETSLLHNARVTGNPVGLIVANKAEQPGKYIEKHAIVSLTLSGDLNPDEASSLLRDLISNVTPATRELLEHGPPHQLPERSRDATSARHRGIQRAPLSEPAD